MYRQYRPARFSDITGQESVTRTLQQAVRLNRITHAYLFYGPRGTGKTTTARVLAARLNCRQPFAAEPCGTCASCTAARASNHLDVIEIDAASNRGIDDIRALRERLTLAPVMGAYKVYIIDEVHMLTNEAASALLKTLEEPAPHVVFVLATTEQHKVLPTILSRCQVYRFRRATRAEMQARLQYVVEQEGRAVPADVLDFIIDRSDGCYRDAESLLGQILTLQEDTVSLRETIEFLGLPDPAVLEEFVRGLYRGESSPTLGAAHRAYEAGVDPEQFVREAIRRARDLALESKDFPRWAAVVRALVQAGQDLAYVPQPLIAIHLAVLTVCDRIGAGQPGRAEEPIVEQPRPTPVAKEQAVRDARERAAVAEEEEETPADAATLSDVERVWEQLIDNLRQSNPVASTFLRAVEPVAIQKGVLTVRTRYTLHKGYFDNPRHKKLLEERLGELLQTNISIASTLAPAVSALPTAAEQRNQQERRFIEMVQDVLKD